MPAVTVFYPRHLFDEDAKTRFKHTVRNSVAAQMDAIDPSTGEHTNYVDAVEKYIDLVLVPYDPEDADVTALCLATIVTYEWPDRMANIAQRLRAITSTVAPFVPAFEIEGIDRISFTFLGKKDGCWAVA